MTPEYLAKEIIEHFNPSGIILDPSRGTGAFYDNFPGDNNVWCELAEDKDFLEYNEKVDWIVTNPPWSKMQKFLAHGMQMLITLCILQLSTTIQQSVEFVICVQQERNIQCANKNQAQLGVSTCCRSYSTWMGG